MRNSLPMIQAVLIMAVIILTPIVIVFSGYSLKAIVTLMFVQFALVTTSFWWELARWLDSSLYTIMYHSPSHTDTDSFWGFLRNDTDNMIMSIVLGTMFLILPGVWIASMSWGGFSLGGLADSFYKGSEQVQKSGSKGIETITKGIK